MDCSRRVATIEKNFSFRASLRDANGLVDCPPPALKGRAKVSRRSAPMTSTTKLPHYLTVKGLVD
jgi:hypothetical protein